MKINIEISYRTVKDEKGNKNILILNYTGKSEELDMTNESVVEIENLNNYILDNIIENDFEITIPEEEDTTNWKIANKIKEIYEAEIKTIKEDLSEFDKSSSEQNKTD